MAVVVVQEAESLPAIATLGKSQAMVICTVTFNTNGGQTLEPGHKKAVAVNPYGNLARTRHLGTGGRAYQFDGWMDSMTVSGPQILETRTVSKIRSHTLCQVAGGL